jgi:hypothetical protein
LKSRLIKFSENDLKRQVKDLLNVYGYYNWPVTAGLGSHPGQPDRIAHIKGRAIYIECKLPKGKLSEHQSAFQEQCQNDGISYWVIRSIEELESILSSWRSRGNLSATQALE